MQGKHPYLGKLDERRGSRNRGSARVLDRVKSGTFACVCMCCFLICLSSLKVFRWWLRCLWQPYGLRNKVYLLMENTLYVSQAISHFLVNSLPFRLCFSGPFDRGIVVGMLLVWPALGFQLPFAGCFLGNVCPQLSHCGFSFSFSLGIFFLLEIPLDFNSCSASSLFSVSTFCRSPSESFFWITWCWFIFHF